jgi:dipeptidase E
MKFYLSSYLIPNPNDLFSLIGKDPAKTKVGLITNSKDYYATRARYVKINRISDYLESLKFIVRTIDLREYNDQDKLKRDLSKFDMLWAVGGNSFCLRYEMKRSGFENIIKEVLQNGVVYAGDSAGAMVVGNSLKGTELADEPEFAEEVIWDGIGLVQHFILPHVNSVELGQKIEQIAKLHKNNKTMVKLTDTQALIINNGIERIVG